ncbi:hypothetical protein K431DRAFT_151431 [Polychaeton citri CBS 116435]|uniref:Uncharacterized protein n=1 Tax=Polychaeton citri CBS 116435 TaxID=1314669 RepID=A0A9P4Q357_9PEZI|nr:hypothetical protein K431DRAFT_151431 [Polychaeton citri CBS 116435]
MRERKIEGGVMPRRATRTKEKPTMLAMCAMCATTAQRLCGPHQLDTTNCLHTAMGIKRKAYPTMAYVPQSHVCMRTGGVADGRARVSEMRKPRDRPLVSRDMDAVRTKGE